MDGFTIFVAALIIFVVLFILIAIANHADDTVQVRSGVAVENYDAVKYFKEDPNRLAMVERRLIEKDKFKLKVLYVSPAGRSTRSKIIELTMANVGYYKSHPTLLMSKSEINQMEREKNKAIKDREKAQKELEKLKKEQAKAEQKAALENKQHEYYDKANAVIDYANANKDSLIIKGDQGILDKAMNELFDRTVNSIKKVKSLDSEEWDMLGGYISNTSEKIERIVQNNKRINDYYASDDFRQIKDTCKSLMDSQREFNEYIEEKAQAISTLFGTRIVRNETENNDKYDYIRPYRKTITPFTAEVSNAVFASAENNPIDYVVKYFYPNKASYPKQIEKLKLLIGELETLRDAKQIIENYKRDYQQYITNVPSYIMENDESGFYSKLGFADISENVLTVEYRFAYTSNGGMAQRSFSIPMTEETIIELIEKLESKLTMEAFSKEQRLLMTKKLRQHIKERDNFTCKICGNSTYLEPNLLLEIDHIKPIAKGGTTEEDNLQTLCWKCNRAKSSKLIG